MKLIRLLALGAMALATLGVQPALAQAQDYPKGPVKMIVPFPPGSATDLAARVIGQQLQTALGKPFVVENKPGAQGTIAGRKSCAPRPMVRRCCSRRTPRSHRTFR